MVQSNMLFEFQPCTECPKKSESLMRVLVFSKLKHEDGFDPKVVHDIVLRFVSSKHIQFCGTLSWCSHVICGNNFLGLHM